MARIVVATMVAVLLLVGAGQQPVGAGEEWCDTDPLVTVVTPAGNVVPVFVLTGAAGLQHLPAAQVAAYDHEVTPADGGKGTAVTLRVTVPTLLAGEPFPTRATASTGPLGTLTVLDRSEGTSGQAMVLRFKLAVP